MKGPVLSHPCVFQMRKQRPTLSQNSVKCFFHHSRTSARTCTVSPTWFDYVLMIYVWFSASHGFALLYWGGGVCYFKKVPASKYEHGKELNKHGGICVGSCPVPSAGGRGGARGPEAGGPFAPNLVVWWRQKTRGANIYRAYTIPRHSLIRETSHEVRELFLFHGWGNEGLVWPSTLPTGECAAELGLESNPCFSFSVLELLSCTLGWNNICYCSVCFTNIHTWPPSLCNFYNLRFPPKYTSREPRRCG